jgi:dolichol-phosphate mannosyltransferase
VSSTRPMIVVPTYMEAANICRLIESLRAHQPGARILVVDDQSPDGTAALVQRQYAGRVGVDVFTRTGPRGYGSAMCDGMRRFLVSDADRLVTLDADFSHDPALVSRMLAALPPDGLVIGSRYLGTVPSRTWAFGRMAASMAGNYYIRALTGLPVTDATSGFRCYTRTALERLRLEHVRATGYAFSVEALYWLWRAGCPIVEVEIIYRDRLYGQSKLSARILSESLALPWRLRLRPAHDATVHRPPIIDARMN